jgi:hypothetical protein
MSRSCTVHQILLPLSSYTFSTFQLAAHKILMAFLFTCLHLKYLFHINLAWFLFSLSVHESRTERSPPLRPVIQTHFSLPPCRCCCWEIFVLLGYWVPSLGVHSQRFETSFNPNPEDEGTTRYRNLLKHVPSDAAQYPRRTKILNCVDPKTWKLDITGLWSGSSKLVWTTVNLRIYCYSVSCGLE